MGCRNEILLSLLNKEVVPATGCTEPVAVAYSTAIARKNLGGDVERLEIFVDGGLYKNGIKVGIPGIKERGLDIAGALGIFSGDSGKGLQVIGDIDEEGLTEAKKLVEEGKVKVTVEEGCAKLYIRTMLRTSKGTICVVTEDRHLNAMIPEMGCNSIKCETQATGLSKVTAEIQNFDLEDFLDFSQTVPIEKLSLLERGVNMNLALAEEGMAMGDGVAKKFEKLVKDGYMHDDLMYRAQLLCASAAEARMSGSRLPAMSSAGSGNHGITVFLTNYAVAQKIGAPKEKLIRALALSNLITFYIKSYTGTLSAMCGCGVAAGIGSSVGVVYLMDGGIKEMLGAIINMVGSIAGIVCDGGKEGCSYKLALSAGWAVQSALLSMAGGVINITDGILASDFKNVIKNLGYVCNPGMLETNEAIIKVMTNVLE